MVWGSFWYIIFVINTRLYSATLSIIIMLLLIDETAQAQLAEIWLHKSGQSRHDGHFIPSSYRPEPPADLPYCYTTGLDWTDDIFLNLNQT